MRESFPKYFLYVQKMLLKWHLAQDRNNWDLKSPFTRCFIYILRLHMAVFFILHCCLIGLQSLHVLVFNLSLWKISAVIWTCYLKLNKILYILHLIRICTIIHIQFILTMLDICKKNMLEYTSALDLALLGIFTFSCFFRYMWTSLNASNCSNSITAYQHT